MDEAATLACVLRYASVLERMLLPALLSASPGRPGTFIEVVKADDRPYRGIATNGVPATGGDRLARIGRAHDREA